MRSAARALMREVLRARFATPLLLSGLALLPVAYASAGAARANADYGARIDELCEAAVQSGKVVGASVVVIKSGRAVWASAYGAANAVAGTPLTIDTALPAASLGKPVAALAALRAVERGLLTLDAPLAAASQAIEGAPPITLRQLLTHTAGLSNFLGERVHRASPTATPRFRYSGVGFLIVQDMLEAQRGRGFTHITREEVLVPLAMNSSSFDHDDLPSAARPHMRLWQSLIPGGIALATVWPIFLLIVLVWRRNGRGRWTIDFRLAGTALIAATVVCALFLYNRSGSWPAALYFTAAPLACVVSGLLLLALVARRLHRRQQKLAASALLVAGLTAMIIACKDLAVPLPELGARRVNAAASFYASAPDLARLMIEVARPSALSFDLTSALVTPQQPVNRDISWGLGIGLASTPRGPVAWHRGSSPGAQGLMLIELATADGVVVLVNDGGGRELVDAVASAVTGLRIGWNTNSD